MSTYLLKSAFFNSIFKIINIEKEAKKSYILYSIKRECKKWKIMLCKVKKTIARIVINVLEAVQQNPFLF